MDVALVCEYLEIKKSNRKLESQVRKLEKQLSDDQAKESELLSKISPDSLITSASVKVINNLLALHRPLYLNKFPVSFAHISYKTGSVRLSAIFSQPIFRGWRTEKPCLSYQSCPWALETPTLPDENHIPEYVSVVDWDIDAVCWEQDGDSLTIWNGIDRGVRFSWGCQNSP